MLYYQFKSKCVSKGYIKHTLEMFYVSLTVYWIVPTCLIVLNIWCGDKFALKKLSSLISFSCETAEIPMYFNRKGTVFIFTFSF